MFDAGVAGDRSQLTVLESSIADRAMVKRKLSQDVSYYYEILGLDATSSTKEDAEKAKRTLAKQYHPDKATVRLQEINAAFDKLEEAGFPTKLNSKQEEKKNKNRNGTKSEPETKGQPRVEEWSVAGLRRHYGGMSKDIILDDLKALGLPEYELKKRRRDQKIELVIFAVEYELASQVEEWTEDVAQLCHSDEVRCWAKAGVKGCRNELQSKYGMHLDELKLRTLWDLVNEVIEKRVISEVAAQAENRQKSGDEQNPDVQDSETLDYFDWDDTDRPQKLLANT